MPNLGRVSSAVLIRTSSWPRGAVGSYLIAIPVARSSATSGISASSEATFSDQAPVGSTRNLPDNRPNTSTARSKVPITPSSSTLGEEPEAWPGWVADGLKSRLARSTPSAMVSTTMPSAKPKSARPMLGPCSESGPSATDPLLVVSPGADGSIRKDWVCPGERRLPGAPAGAVPLPVL